MRATFITLATNDGANPDVLETRVTHTRPRRCGALAASAAEERAVLAAVIRDRCSLNSDLAGRGRSDIALPELGMLAERRRQQPRRRACRYALGAGERSRGDRTSSAAGLAAHRPGDCTSSAPALVGVETRGQDAFLR